LQTGNVAQYPDYTVKTKYFSLPPIILQVVIYPNTAGYVSTNNAVFNWKEKKNENIILRLSNNEASPQVPSGIEKETVAWVFEWKFSYVTVVTIRWTVCLDRSV